MIYSCSAKRKDIFLLYGQQLRKSEYETCIDIESYILTQARIISLSIQANYSSLGKNVGFYINAGFIF